MSADTGPTTAQDRSDTVAAGDPPRGRTGGLFASEVLTLFRRRRTQAILAVLAGVPILIAVAVKLSSAPRPGEGPPLLDRVTQNGLFVGVTALVVSVPLFVPLAIGVVAGDTIAGEANLGTLRYLLLAPAGRTRLLAVKYACTAVFCFAATLTVVLTGAVVGGALFGLRPVTLLSGDAVSVPESFVRALLVAAYVSVSMLGMSAIGLFVSTLTEIPVGAMAATVTLAVTSQILGGIPQVDWLHPYLFSHHWLDLGDLLRTPVVWDSFVANGRLQLAYVAVFTALAWARLTTKDVLS
ncbi:ABC transporter permease [Kineosporia sp. R_H_3]|uniref:ABC transporter permease n=1 Tax=Kineosporia sp. R_H_3 TaxID=1961848 RepID=UPI000B4ADC86|nr:ABC transporter permease [Kineosporia sp. R_H_3]